MATAERVAIPSSRRDGLSRHGLLSCFFVSPFLSSCYFFMLPFDGRRGMKAKVGVGKSFVTTVVFRSLFFAWTR